MSNLTYCTKEKRESCKHWNKEANTCPYLRKFGDTKSCWIAGIEDRYEDKK